jgi:hypothetical protein
MSPSRPSSNRKVRPPTIAGMNRDLRHHATRRERAIEQIGAITTAAAMAGIAGTIGFGVVAAASFSGTTTADAPSTDGSAPIDLTPDNSNDQRVFRLDDQPPPQNSGSNDFGAAPAPRSRSSGGGHATTGGSG